MGLSSCCKVPDKKMRCDGRRVGETGEISTNPFSYLDVEELWIISQMNLTSCLPYLISEIFFVVRPLS